MVPREKRTSHNPVSGLILPLLHPNAIPPARTMLIVILHSLSRTIGRFSIHSVVTGQILSFVSHSVPTLTRLDRSNLSRSSARLRRIISSPDFEAYFGKAQPSAKAGERQNIFGAEDELKVAPKGFAKDHPYVFLFAFQRCLDLAMRMEMPR